MNRRRGLCLAVLLALGCSAPIQHGLDEGAANEIVTSLERAGIGASKSPGEDGAFAVSVSAGDAIRAMEMLRSLGLPRGQRAGFGEIYKQASLVPTPTEERARYVEALAGELAHTLETIEGVVSARVHLVLPELDPLAMDGNPRVPAQAAVLLKIRPGRPLPVAETEVQKLIAGSVPGLSREGVAVVVTSAAEPPAAHETGLVTLGPLRLTADSRTLVVVATTAGFVLLALLAGLLLLLARRLAAAQGKG